MLRYVIQKIINRKWMAISLIIGNVLLIGMVVGSTVYSSAIMNRVLKKDLNNYMIETGVYPLQAEVSLRMDESSNSAKIAPRIEQIEKFLMELPGKMQLDQKELVTCYYIESYYSLSLNSKLDNKDYLHLSFLSDLDKHSKIISGNMYSNKIEDGVIEAIVTRKTMVDQNLMVGQELYLKEIQDTDGNPYKIRIAGVFENSDQDDPYWVESPDAYKQSFFMDEDLFRSLFVNYKNPPYRWNSTWNILLRDDNMKTGKVNNILSGLTDLNDIVKVNQCNYYKEYFGDLLKEFQLKQTKVDNIIFLLETPIFILLAIFIYMVNNQMMLLERGDIAVLKSRGASNGQIIRIYLYQASIIVCIGLLLGIPLGLLFCNLLGNANAFLEFVSRSALQVELTTKAIVYAILCAFLSLGITLLIAFSHMRESIVSYKRKKNSRNKKYITWGFFTGAALLGISFYSLYNYKIHAEALAQSAQAGKGLDPLLFCSSIIFIMGAAFIVISIFPIIIQLIFKLGRSLWGPSSYASFQKVIKGSDNQGFIIMFLILTVSLGIFSTTIARTINKNEEDRIVYSTGADLVLQEKWDSNQDELQNFSNTMQAVGQYTSNTDMDVVYEEPDFNRYKKLEGVKEATKVLVNTNINAEVDSGEVKVMLMGIHTKEFGETAYFKTDLLDQHWYKYLNAIAKEEDGILVSSNFRDDYGYKVGDMIAYSDSDHSVRGKICGFVDYWPSYEPVIKKTDTDGVAKETKQYLIVANIAKLQSVWGITPYQIWIKAKESTSFIYQFAKENQIEYLVFKDLSSEIINKNNDPIFQGTNGILTLGFIVILLICAVGFLIFWILSIFSRSLQFGVFRAMGMTVREIIGMLIREQFFLSVIPIFFGILIGNITSKLFVPFIQIAYSSSEQMIPLEVINLQSDRIRILGTVGFMIIICMVVISKIISDLKMTQALKLGED